MPPTASERSFRAVALRWSHGEESPEETGLTADAVSGGPPGLSLVTTCEASYAAPVGEGESRTPEGMQPAFTRGAGSGGVGGAR
jgi:hypothetical protein